MCVVNNRRLFLAELAFGVPARGPNMRRTKTYNREYYHAWEKKNKERLRLTKWAKTRDKRAKPWSGKKPWTKKETEFVRDHWKQLTTLVMAAYLGRGYHSVLNKRKEFADPEASAKRKLRDAIRSRLNRVLNRIRTRKQGA